MYLSPEIIQYESKIIIHIHVLPGAEVYSYKKVIYDRVDEADVKVTATAQIAQMYIRKQEIFTERKVYPSYVTDALLRRINVDRYDDREIVQTNLIESYELLMEFARKHLPDKFFMENDQRKSLRNIITREMIANTLIHREYTSPYQAKFVIEKDRMYVENANRASQDAVITPDNMESFPKNPLIAAFFRNIGYADQLGSGVRNLFKYRKYYSGKDPEFIEGDIFRIIVPLDDDYSFDFGQAKPGHDAGSPEYADIDGKSDESTGKVYEKLNASQKKIIGYVEKNGMITNKEAQKLLDIKESRALKILRELTDLELLKKEGKSKGTYYVLQNKGGIG